MRSPKILWNRSDSTVNRYHYFASLSIESKSKQIMNLLKMYKTYRRMMRAQWLDRLRIQEIQERKLRHVVRQAYKTVPFYKRLFDEAGISPVNINTLYDLERIPITTKSILQEFAPEFLINRTMDPGNLKTEHSSGSTGRPFTVFFNSDYLYVRNALFLRGLRAAGYNIGRKLLLVTSSGSDKRSKHWLRWRYASIQDPPELLLEQVNRFRPDFLYGFTTPLRQLAEYICSTNSLVFQPEKIITTAEMIDTPTRRFLEDTFNAEVYDFYGSTEMGLIGWECTEHNGHHLAEDTTIIEHLPIENAGDVSKLVMTNLDLMSMPFIRFDAGDVGIPGKREPCRCGRGFSLLERVEGRIVDCVQLKDGRRISPYKLTCELEKLQGIARYQVIQEDYGRFTVKVESGKRGVTVRDDEIYKVMHSVLGKEIKVVVQKNVKIEPTPGRKFRVIESEVARVINS
ncbi:MAG: phenylacetate--CoA ligase family protein [Candidatus Hodarchaeota archaeon]